MTLLLGGAACVAVGAIMGSRWTPGAAKQEPLWRATDASQAPTVTASVPSFRGAVERVGPSVVTVRARLRSDADANADTERDAEPRNRVAAPDSSQPVTATEPGRRTGTGFVIHEKGLILTSRHVVVDAVSVEVIVPQHGPKWADLVGEDRATDLALLRLVDTPAGLTPLSIGSSEDLRAGDWIVTVGNPFGFSRTVTAGVVSFVGRHLPHSDFGVTNDFLQISAPVNPGSSGCPVVDAQGQVVGVTTQVAAAAQGISFAVPSRSVKWALDAMARQPDGRVRRGYLGIEFASLSGYDEAGAPRAGAVIVRVAADKPADRAGLRMGDVVLAVDGTAIHDAKELHERIVCTDPGTPIALQLLRDGEIHAPIVAVLGEVGRRDAPAKPAGSDAN